MTRGPQLARAALLCVVAIAVAIGCARWPLATYGCTLVLFGVPHALVELQWVSRRYGERQRIVAPIVTVLAAIAGARLAALWSGWPTASAATIELGLGMLLVGCVWSRRRVGGGARSGAAVAVLVLLGSGVALAPVDALLVLAIAHNLAPAGLLADRLRDADVAPTARARFAAAGLLAFVALPLWLATGGATALLELAATATTPGDLAAAGGLGLVLFDGLGAFTPSFVAPAHALDLLRAAAFLQIAHYAAVLLVLPRIGPRAAAERRAAPPPVRRAFAALVVVLALVFAVAFVVDFREARATYGVLAAVHVWLEFPALLLALTPRAIAKVAA